MLTDNEILTLTVAATGVLISVVAVVISYRQLLTSVRQSRHQATFEHLGRVRKLLRELSGIDPEAARAAALAYYNHEIDELPQSAKDYLDLLDEWDLLGVAYKHKQIDRKIVLDQLRNTLRDPHHVNRDFIREIKQALANPRVYQDLDLLIRCCVRPTLFEWITAKGKRFYDRSEAKRASAPTTPSSLTGTISGRGNTGIPSASGASAATTPEVAAEITISSPQTEVVMPDPQRTTPAPSPTRTPSPTPPSPPRLPSREERGETPGFRRPPPSPPPPQEG